jgi:hypothetical protein
LLIHPKVVAVGVGLGPAVAVCEGVAVAVGVLVAPPEVSITNCGAFAPSRLEKLSWHDHVSVDPQRFVSDTKIETPCDDFTGMFVDEHREPFPRQ